MTSTGLQDVEYVSKVCGDKNVLYLNKLVFIDINGFRIYLRTNN